MTTLMIFLAILALMIIISEVMDKREEKRYSDHLDFLRACAAEKEYNRKHYYPKGVVIHKG